MSKAAKALARLRWAKAKREPKTCPFCGVEFPGSEKQVYCTPAHQNAAAARRFRARHSRPPVQARDGGWMPRAEVEKIVLDMMEPPKEGE